ncbi:MAG: alcohol dehydrogenase catalytic domain-containing protein, partial [Actinobacteria bacterium]|nr:alcohol dehydrogenase catalytic domain-containing protein [Actinomycetota bacterium]
MVVSAGPAALVSRAAVLERFETPIRMRSVEVPEPRPGAVVTEVLCAGICGTDIHLQDGRLPIPIPVVLGHEAVGTVAALGEGVDSDALGRPLGIGDRVMWASSIACGTCYYCRQIGEPTLCANRSVFGINRRADQFPRLSGAWADFQYLDPGTTIIRLPDDVSTEAAISLGCAGPTSVHGVVGIARPRVGDTVVVQGSGPVGLAAAMYARLSGVERIVMVGGPAARLELARTLGVADAYIDIFEVKEPAERLVSVLRDTQEGRGGDVVIEATGVPSAVAEGLEMCRPAGTYLVLGQYTDHGATPINP